MNFKSLSTKLLFLSAVMLGFTGIYIISGFFFTRSLKGEANQINMAGHLRYRSYEMAWTLEQLVSSKDTEERKSLSSDLAARQERFERIISALMNGDREIGVMPIDAPEVRDSLDALQDRYRKTLIPLMDKIKTLPDSEARAALNEYNKLIQPYVEEVSSLVALLARHQDENIRRFDIFRLYAFAFFIAASTFVIIFARRNIIAPIKSLTSITRRVKEGDLSARVEIKSEDEIGELAGSFNQMISDQDKAFREIMEHSKDLEALARTTEEIENLRQDKTIYDVICSSIVHNFEIRMAWIGLVKDEGFGVTPLGVAGYNDGYLNSIKVTTDNSATGMGPMGTAIKTGKPVVMKTTDEAFTPWREEADRRGYRSVLALPLVFEDGMVVGGISIYSSQDEYFAGEKLDIFNVISKHISIALDNSWLMEGLEDKVSERTKEVAAARDELAALNEELVAMNEELSANNEELMATNEELEATKEEAENANANLKSFDYKLKRLYEISFSSEVGKSRDFVRKALMGMADMLDLDAVVLGELRDGKWIVFALADRNGIGIREGEAFPAGELSCEILHEMEGCNNPDHTLNDPCTYHGLTKYGVSCCIGVPIHMNGMPFGSLCSLSKVPHRFSEYEVVLHQLLAKRMELEFAHEKYDNELRMAIKDADAANRAKTEFLANMSHELRTPLHTIISFSEVMRDGLFGPLNEKQYEYTDSILQSGWHLLELIKDILDMSKIESGKMDLRMEALQVSPLIEDCLKMLKEKALKGDVNLKHDLIGEGNLEVEADRIRLKQIMLNLLGNAVKFTPPGGSVTVETGYKKDPGSETDFNVRLEISVADTGIGIKEEDIQRLFKPFSQLESAFVKRYEGTGLGLALTKKLVELHGGKIWVESEPRKGSRFTFSIPLRQKVAGGPR